MNHDARDSGLGASLAHEPMLEEVASDGVPDRRRHRGTQEARDASFGTGSSRALHEAVWTAADYADLTEVSAAVPVHWRFFLKHRVLDAIASPAKTSQRGDGREVRAAFQQLAAEFPQLARHQAAGVQAAR